EGCAPGVARRGDGTVPRDQDQHGAAARMGAERRAAESLCAAWLLVHPAYALGRSSELNQFAQWPNRLARPRPRRSATNASVAIAMLGSGSADRACSPGRK